MTFSLLVLFRFDESYARLALEPACGVSNSFALRLMDRREAGPLSSGSEVPRFLPLVVVGL